MGKGQRGRPPGPTARYRVLADDLGRRLASGIWAAGKAMPSCRQLAREYGVSFNTALRAVRALRAEGRVRLAPRSVPVAALGAPLSAIMTGALAVVIKTTLEVAQQPSGLDEVWNGVVQAASRHGTPLVVLHHLGRWRYELPVGLRELPLSGVLLMGPFVDDMLRAYETLGLPVVLLDQPGDAYSLHSVAVANHEAAFEATRRMIALGHRRLAFVRPIVRSLGNLDPDSLERQAGFESACADAGFASSQYRVFSAYSSAAAGAKIVSSDPPFTGVLTSDAMQAEQFATVARESGLKVPRDLSIVTFRGSRPLSRDWSGFVTDFSGMARLAVDILRRKPPAPERIRVKPQWRGGDSLGPSRP
jgi:LacI family transcriptional regulator